MAKRKPSQPSSTSGAAPRQASAEAAVALAENAAGALAAAELLRMKAAPVAGLAVTAEDRAALRTLPALSAEARQVWVRGGPVPTVAAVAAAAMAAAEASLDARSDRRNYLLALAEKLIGCLRETLSGSRRAGRVEPKPAEYVYRLKITLVDIRPPIWRRILVRDCTLDELHAHIQTAMGWTNSHLHHFLVGDDYYGDPALIGENFREFGYYDSRATALSGIVPARRKAFRFGYEYDFGDSWRHVIEVEGAGPPDAGATYPACVAGRRACPPEDVGGAWGYPGFLKAVADPRDERHGELLEWLGGPFDPEEFDPAAATARMREGLPGWRTV